MPLSDHEKQILLRTALQLPIPPIDGDRLDMARAARVQFVEVFAGSLSLDKKDDSETTQQVADVPQKITTPISDSVDQANGEAGKPKGTAKLPSKGRQAAIAEAIAKGETKAK